MGKKFFVELPPPLPNNSVFYEFPTVWEYQGFVGNWLVFFFLGFVMLYLITSEVSNKTMRQNIITGMTRKDYFLGKLYTMIAISLVATIIYVLSSIIIGVIHTEGWDFGLLMDTNKAIIRYFLMCIGYMSFAMLVAFLVRKGGLAIFLYFAYILIIEMILKWAVTFNIFIKMDNVPNSLVNYWPLNVIEDLMPNPLLRFPTNFMNNSDINFDILLPVNHAIGFSVLYIAVFIALSWWIFNRRDV